MVISNRIALSLTIAVHILFLCALVSSSRHPAQAPTSGEPLTVRFISMLAPLPAKLEALAPPLRKRAPFAAPPHAVSAPMPAALAVETKASEKPAQADVGAGLLAQSALNAIGKIDRDERRGSVGSSSLTSNSLSARLSASIDKNSAVPAGTIDEIVYPDGRREERIHGPFGSVYCITYDSPSNPTDGFDMMQRGLKRSMPHTCGHRFD